MPSLTDIVRAAQRPEVREAVHALYQDLQSQINERKPRCDASGRCCHFDTYGHRLYITTAELATFITDYSALPTLSKNPRSLPLLASTDACPLLENNLCSVHTIRPFGCRIYFCDATAQEWMTEAYERFHRRLVALHQELDVEYRYVEWRQALTELRIPILAL